MRKGKHVEQGLTSGSPLINAMRERSNENFEIRVNNTSYKGHFLISNK